MIKDESLNPDGYPPIRSFVRRNRRLTAPQKIAMQSTLPIYGIDFSKQILDINAIFGRSAPKIVEIGSGMGHACAQIANNNQNNDYLAIEVHRPGIASLMLKIEKYTLTNVRLIEHDVSDILKYQLANNSIEEIYIFFPDPWPKKKHHKRRLINQSFLNLVKNVLKKHGRIFVATDWQDYAEQIITLIAKQPDFINLAGDTQYAPRPEWRPVTKFEQRSIDRGERVYDIAIASSH